MNERICRLRIKGLFFNYSIIKVHCPHEERSDDDMNAQVAREEMFRPMIGPDSLNTVSNDNDQRCFNFAASRGMVVRSSFFPHKDILKATWISPDHQTTNQIDHVLIDGRFFSDITNIRTAPIA